MGRKAVVIVTYGGHGGSKCAAQLRQVAEGLNMRPVTTMPGITLTRAMITSGAVDPQKDFRSHSGAIRKSLAELVRQLESATA